MIKRKITLTVTTLIPLNSNIHVHQFYMYFLRYIRISLDCVIYECLYYLSGQPAVYISFARCQLIF